MIRETLLLLTHSLRAGGCQVIFEPQAEVMHLWGPPGRLIQAVTNLVTNAIDASAPKQGGNITIRLHQREAAVVLEVADEGVGIPQSNLKRIFDPMYTSKPFGEGTGLGLTIVHDVVVSDYGGRVDVRSEVGRGTTFVLVLPVRQTG